LVASFSPVAEPEEMHISGARPLVIHSHRPDYPKSARQQGLGGHGEFAMSIDPETGAVVSVDTIKSTGVPLLDQCAIRAFRQWRFKPHTVTRVRTPITFSVQRSDVKT
jgi:TonB family protein